MSFTPAVPPPAPLQHDFMPPMGGPARPVFQSGHGPEDMGQAYR